MSTYARTRALSEWSRHTGQMQAICACGTVTAVTLVASPECVYCGGPREDDAHLLLCLACALEASTRRAAAKEGRT